ncbi:SAM-dependent methyltransferase, MidA family [Marininema mesophilum]|uniref:SAM-dependent methyltransferase, MidA family n=1 Tax=Marininema mesophilum TaxID=1048340 RepID=A0A1H2QHJ9_9BACL|nr:SAM-dependent methyltransferase [Marininema mesophilum]SDW06410.1 SAM-dependent methyltransferase, MidA family [Marininema mesophilum]
MGQELLQSIVAEVTQSKHGRIPFARFMELALYHPEYGYYQTDWQKTGRRGDFFTSPQVGDLFGLTIGRGILILAESFPPDQPWLVVEVGGGDGRLMEGIVKAIEGKGNAVQPTIGMIETSLYHRHLQQERLSGVSLPVQWVSRLEELPQGQPTIVVSNELLDALPFHRFRWRDGEWLEIWVGWDETTSRLIEVEGSLSNEGFLPMLKDRMGDRIPDEGSETEISLVGRDWIQSMGTWIEQGYLLTVDYGGTDEELCSPLRKVGTARGFQAHQMVRDLLISPGEVDITADVSFTLLQSWGEEVGFLPLWYGKQSRFLLEVGILEEISPVVSTDPFSKEAKRIRSLRQLALPGGMGDSYQVLLQGKGVACPEKALIAGDKFVGIWS